MAARLFLRGRLALWAAAWLALFSTNASAHHITMRPGFFGHVVVELAVSPWDGSSLYVAAFGQGVFVTRDGGNQWLPLNDGLTEKSVRGLAFGTAAKESEGVLYYLATDQGVFRRAPGRRWEPMPGLRERSVRALRFGTEPAPVLYAATEAGVFASADRGRSWEARNRGLAHRDVRALAVLPGRIFAGTFGGVFRSADGGRSWQPASRGLADLHVRFLLAEPGAPARLFAATAFGGVFESGDGGNSWRARNQGLIDTSVMALARGGGALYAGTRGGLFRLPPGGDAWQYVRVDRIPLSVPAVATGREGEVYVSSGGEVFESRDEGKTWILLTPGGPPRTAKQEPTQGR
ncbi:MAG: hypothetical protein HY618_05425 [Candidatus Tectomicrobia bacterium]|uniref:Photosynthesis system II assembly factor Ycf48/Hcf136-like domain-containing protein n=1 Tax=Tectimicrobiota bacterium TaxID=2528274 RepID=A0A932ZUI2_UNCTE|nr:hypothetical protein [Candidatus Tectomicrobia bacterium]